MAEDRERPRDDEPDGDAADSSEDRARADSADDADDVVPSDPDEDTADSKSEAEDDAPDDEVEDDDAEADDAEADDAEADDAEADDAEAEASKKAASDDTKAKGSGRASKLWWALPILMLVEFYMYGHNGRLEICVGKEGDTDFSLVGQQRTDENRWKFPRCETRLNLGLRSQREVKVEEGTKVACRGATIFRHQGEGKACVAGDKGWVHRVEGHFVPPWDQAYYEHLFWFLQ